jgi:eukaryotic-like serine/threonine-protein kinase
MAKKLKVGDTIHGYRIVKVFGPGMMAISYAAEGRSGQKVFFKQYKSPAPTVVWYPAFVAYQKELGERVQRGRAAHFAVRQLDAFEEVWGGRCYFQAFEFVERGGDLQQMLDAERERHRATKLSPAREPAVWARHVTWAKVLTAAVAALHESNIVHADLKPANAYLVEDSSLGSGYQLKLIDMDFSLLADKKAPWHGFQGYVGSDNYRSPEHLTRGAVPGPASDVFTCGLILHELLVGEHPYARDDQAEYGALVLAHAAKPRALLGALPPPALNAEVSALLHRCLSPNPAARPTAAALRDALTGRSAKAELPKTKPELPGKLAPAVGAAPVTRPTPTNREPLVCDGIELVSANGRILQIGVRTELGKAVVRQLGIDGEFWDNRQCVVERSPTRQWTVTPVAGSVNDTLVNGKTLAGPRPLLQGDVIAVGRQEKGVVKLPLTVRRR